MASNMDQNSEGGSATCVVGQVASSVCQADICWYTPYSLSVKHRIKAGDIFCLFVCVVESSLSFLNVSKHM